MILVSSRSVLIINFYDLAPNFWRPPYVFIACSLHKHSRLAQETGRSVLLTLLSQNVHMYMYMCAPNQSDQCDGLIFRWLHCYATRAHNDGHGHRRIERIGPEDVGTTGSDIQRVLATTTTSGLQRRANIETIIVSTRGPGQTGSHTQGEQM